MRISIRADWCIALRMIALQEYNRQAQEFLLEVLKQEPLDENLNLEELFK